MSPRTDSPRAHRCAAALACVCAFWGAGAASASASAETGGNRGMDAGHSGQAPAAPTPPLVADWSRADLTRQSGVAPVAGAGRLFVSVSLPDMGRVFALDPATGATVWQAPSARGRLAVAAGRLLTTILPGEQLASLDPATGNQGWTLPYAPLGPAAADDTLALAPSSSGMRAIDPVTGAVRWETRDGAGPAALDADRAYVATPGPGGCQVRAYARADGRAAWSAPCGVTTAGVEVIAAAGLVDAGGYVLDAATGAERFAGTASPSTAVDSDGTLYALTDGTITATAADGTLRWRASMTGQPAGDPLIAGQTLYAASQDGTLSALDTRSGAVSWTAVTGLTGPTDMTVAAGRLILDNQAGVRAYDASVLRKVRASRIRLRRGRGTARVTLRLDRRARVTAVVSSGTRRLARVTRVLAPGAHVLTVPLAPTAAGGLRVGSRVTLRVTARAADGATGAVTFRVGVG